MGLLEFAQLLAVFILLYEFFLPVTIAGPCGVAAFLSSGSESWNNRDPAHVLMRTGLQRGCIHYKNAAANGYK